MLEQGFQHKKKKKILGFMTCSLVVYKACLVEWNTDSTKGGNIGYNVLDAAINVYANKHKERPDYIGRLCAKLDFGSSRLDLCPVCVLNTEA